MTSTRSINKNMKNLLSNTRQYNEGPSNKLQTLSFMTLLWPLLPKLPPGLPARSAIEQLKNIPTDGLDQCDVCGCPATPALPRQRKIVTSHTTSPGTKVSPIAAAVMGDKSPLAKMMADIEKKVDATLDSIDQTSKRTDQLDQETKELELAAQGNITDAELVETLKSLMKEKSNREERVKALELKEQELKDSLKTAIDWAKNVDANTDK